MNKEEKARKIDEVIGKIDNFKMVSILRNLIRIPSFTGEEKMKADYVAKEMERLGLEVIETYIDYPKGRRNVLGIMRNDGRGESLMLCAHLDTRFPREQEQFTNFETRIEGDRIYGNGTGDSMSPLAAIFGALDAVKRAGVKLKGDVIFLASSDEMCFKEGALLLEENGITVDKCLIGEATDLDIGIVHTGKAELEIKTVGKSGYEIGVYAERMGQEVINAILSMNTIINYLRQMVKEDPYFQKNHPLLLGKGAALNIGTIIGGSTGDGDPTRRPGRKPGEFGLAKRTPEYCYLRVGVRYWPGQTAQEFYDVVRKYLAKAKVEDSSVEAEVNLYLDHGNEPYEIHPDTEIVQKMKSSIKHVLGKDPKLIGNIYSTEAPFFKRAGMEVVWCAPGMGRVGGNEYVTKKELLDTCKIYTAAIINICT